MSVECAYECISRDLSMILWHIRTKYASDPHKYGWVVDSLYDAKVWIEENHEFGYLDDTQSRRLRSRWYYARRALNKECTKLKVSLT